VKQRPKAKRDNGFCPFYAENQLRPDVTPALVLVRLRMAAGSWDSLAAELGTTAEAYQSAISG
jgi:PPE-repeat protein